MKYFFSFLALVFSYTSFGQLTIGAQSSCSSYTLTATMTGLTPTSSGITADDGWSSVIPIGFTYTFYGNNYTQCVIGSNGELGFNTGSAGAYNTWPISGTLASTAAGGGDVRNLIAGPWCDIYIPGGGTLMYSLVGTAPNRKFEVTFCHEAMYSCTTQWISTQIIIYEGTNIAEVHIGHHTFNVPSLCGWNGNYAECGVVNNNGTSCTMAPGPAVRDYPNTWNAYNESWRFTPSPGGVGPYSVSSIPYAPIPYASSAIYWYDSATHAYLGSGATITVTPAVTTTYEAVALGCGDSTKAYITVAGVSSASSGAPHISAITSTNPTLCGLCDGTIKLHGIVPLLTDSVFESINGVPQAPFTTATAADSIVSFSSKCEGNYAYYIKVGSCPSNTVTATLTMPAPIPASFTYTTKLGCNGDSIFLTNTTSPSIYYNLWDFGDGTATSTAVNTTHIYYDNPSYVGSYTVTLTYNTTTNPAYIATCQTVATIPISFDHQIDAHIYSTAPDTSACWMTPLTVTGTTVSVNNPTYQWIFGDGSPIQTTNPAEYQYPLPGDYTVTFTVTDSIGCVRIDSEHVHLIQIKVRTATHDTSVCLVDSMGMTAFVTVLPNTSSINALWDPTNNIGVNSYTGTGDGTYSTNFMGLGDYLYTFTATTPLPSSSPIPYCSATDTEAIHSYPPITLINLTASQTIPWGSSLQLNSDGALYYTWRPNDGSVDNPNINNPIVTPYDSVTTYVVYGMSQYGCLDSARITITLGTMTEVVPSAFTPNGDGLNDVFRITNMTFQKLVDFRIYNRWGQQVFQTASRDKGWDGTFNGVPQDLGVYSYTIIVGLVDGTTKSYQGTVTLIR